MSDDEHDHDVDMNSDDDANDSEEEDNQSDVDGSDEDGEEITTSAPSRGQGINRRDRLEPGESISLMSDDRVKELQLQGIEDNGEQPDDTELSPEKNIHHNYVSIPLADDFRDLLQEEKDKKKEREKKEEDCIICMIEDGEYDGRISKTIKTILNMYVKMARSSGKRSIHREQKMQFKKHITQKLRAAGMKALKLKTRHFRRHYERSCGGCGNQTIPTLSYLLTSTKRVHQAISHSALRKVNPQTGKEHIDLKAASVLRSYTRDIMDIQQKIDEAVEKLNAESGSATRISGAALIGQRKKTTSKVSEGSGESSSGRREKTSFY